MELGHTTTQVQNSVFDKVLWSPNGIQEDACVMTRFGPCWHKSKTKWANIVSVVLYVGNKDIIILPKLTHIGTVKNTLAQPWLNLSQFGAS